MKNKDIEIFVEKETKSALGLFVKFLFGGVMSYLWIVHNFVNTEQETAFNNGFGKWLLGISLFLYWITFVWDIIKYFKQGEQENKVGLLINRRGITNFHTPMSEVRLIPWNDIEFIGTKGSLSGNYLIIKVKNPDDYIQKAESFELKKLLRNNRTKYETPIAILINGLDISADELRKKAKIEFVKYKKW